ncbi:MAG: DUF6273 domain-containing protein [Clostridiales Family XIII bacterium]|jgi:hypothetical protein|nr:DUF6273 domain-containing protein [Clostridiales Family XIII bacterium]
MAEYVIEKRPYNSEATEVTWESCTLSEYLNNEFFDNFSRHEQAGILETKNVNPATAVSTRRACSLTAYSTWAASVSSAGTAVFVPLYG